MQMPEYLLAMKCMATCIGATTAEHSDVSDITFLITHLGLKCAHDLLDIVALSYSPNQIPVKYPVLWGTSRGSPRAVIRLIDALPMMQKRGNFIDHGLRRRAVYCWKAPPPCALAIYS